MKNKLNSKKIIEKSIEILKKNKVKKAGIFGSYARGEQKKESDIDILVEVQRGWSLLDVVRLEIELQKILKKKVDLLTYKSINHRLKDIILNEEVKII